MRGVGPQARRAVGTGLLMVAATVVYYLVPVPHRMRETWWAVMFGAGVLVLAALIVLAVRRLLRTGVVTRIRGLLLVLTVTVLFFSWADESVARLPDQFVSLTTKTDALYFNISTLATVGFGDVHASGQLARAAVTLQIIFNLVIIGTAVGMISGLVQETAKKRMRGSDQGNAGGGEPAGGDQG